VKTFFPEGSSKATLLTFPGRSDAGCSSRCRGRECHPQLRPRSRTLERASSFKPAAHVRNASCEFPSSGAQARTGHPTCARSSRVERKGQGCVPGTPERRGIPFATRHSHRPWANDQRHVRSHDRRFCGLSASPFARLDCARDSTELVEVRSRRKDAVRMSDKHVTCTDATR
jgi:hypothetical protein